MPTLAGGLAWTAQHKIMYLSYLCIAGLPSLLRDYRLFNISDHQSSGNPLPDTRRSCDPSKFDQGSHVRCLSSICIPRECVGSMCTLSQTSLSFKRCATPCTLARLDENYGSARRDIGYRNSRVDRNWFEDRGAKVQFG
ncbi:hypothetical protein V8E51_010977 [Hyaloscypha variabilis]